MSYLIRLKSEAFSIYSRIILWGVLSSLVAWPNQSTTLGLTFIVPKEQDLDDHSSSHLAMCADFISLVLKSLFFIIGPLLVSTPSLLVFPSSSMWCTFHFFFPSQIYLQLLSWNIKQIFGIRKNNIKCFGFFLSFSYTWSLVQSCKFRFIRYWYIITGRCNSSNCTSYHLFFRKRCIRVHVITT